MVGESSYDKSLWLAATQRIWKAGYFEMRRGRVTNQSACRGLAMNVLHSGRPDSGGNHAHVVLYVCGSKDDSLLAAALNDVHMVSQSMLLRARAFSHFN